MRWLVLLAALVALPAGAAPRDWTRSAVQGPAGAFVVGNPAAKAKLVEYASYVCPHCAHFSRESAATLRGRMLASGSLSLEVRPLVQDQVDLAAALVARCAGPAGFLAVTEALFAAQDDWYWRARGFVDANGARIANYPALGQLRQIADGGGISAVAAANGVPAARLDQCFADRAVVDQVLRISDAARRAVNATPTFSLNGRLITGVDWAHLEPMLRAAGAR